MKRGVPPTARKARTGELTPPGVTARARSKRAAEPGASAGEGVPGPPKAPEVTVEVELTPPVSQAELCASYRGVPTSGHAETERVPGRIEEHAEARARLVLVLRRAEFEHRGLRGVEVVDDDVDVHLLRHLLAGPARRRVVLDLLEPDRVAVVRLDLGPVRRDLDLPVQELAVEGGEGRRVRAVEDDRGKACDSHGEDSMGGCGRSASGTLSGAEISRASSRHSPCQPADGDERHDEDHDEAETPAGGNSASS